MLIPAGIGDSGGVQGVLGVQVTLFAVIQHVVVAQGNEFHGASREYVYIIRRSPENEILCRGHVVV